MHSSKTNPYSKKLAKHFWRTAIADLESVEIGELWNPKFKITLSSKILTVGSCFAKHISNWLKVQGFGFIDSEPAPAHLSKTNRENQGYGIFSFRVGNVYSAAMLKQWVFWALGLKKCPRVSFSEQGKYYDPFRPSIPKEGFDKLDSLIKERIFTLKCIRNSILDADTFIFTLGLTEGWIDIAGYIYAICPGTIRGEFSPEHHLFKNSNYTEIYDDLNDTIQEIRAVNPSMRFLFTVSPIPLTATNTKNHVLSATIYSKSVLRSVAGDLADKYDFVDYFPSYELITATPFRGNFFEKNLRTVKKCGVDFVMEHFKHGVKLANSPTVFINKNMQPTSQSSHMPVLEKYDEGDEFCDDAALEGFNRYSTDYIEDPTISFLKGDQTHKICLLGDSHMGCFSTELVELKVPHCGGYIMNGSAWRRTLFTLNEDCFFLPHENLDSQKKWANTYDVFFSGRDLSSCTLITNIGNHLHTAPFQLDYYLEKVCQIDPHVTATMELLNKFIEWSCRLQFRLLTSFVKSGLKVICVTDPPFQHLRHDNGSKDPNLYANLDRILINNFELIGCKVFDSRKWTKDFLKSKVDRSLQSLLSSRMVEGKRDWLHGSKLFYQKTTEALVTTFKILN